MMMIKEGATLKKILGWQLGLILAAIGVGAELLSVYVRSIHLAKSAMASGILAPTLWMSASGHITVDWVSGVLGFVLIIVYFINRRTWKTASKGYLFIDVMGTTLMTSGLYTALVFGAANIYPEANLHWQANWLGGLTLFVLFWLFTETLLMAASAAVLAWHGLRVRRVGSRQAVMPSMLLVMTWPYVSWLTTQGQQVSIPGGVYHFGPLANSTATSGWGTLVVLIFALAAAGLAVRNITDSLDA